MHRIIVQRYVKFKGSLLRRDLEKRAGASKRCFFEKQTVNIVFPIWEGRGGSNDGLRVCEPDWAPEKVCALCTPGSAAVAQALLPYAEGEHC
jgi:hypothetical protein